MGDHRQLSEKGRPPALGNLLIYLYAGDKWVCVDNAEKKKATRRWLFLCYKYQISLGNLVGAIGLEPTTPSMSR